MPDEPPESPSATLPAFAPVPRAKPRSNGWKPEVQRAFIEALAETGSVKSAARRVGRAEVGAYLLRRHPQAEEFRRAWDAALDIGMRRIEDVAMDRALNGVEVPVYSYGKLVGTRTVYNDRLLMFMLRNRAPERFAGGGAKGMNALDRHQLERLKRQWREEWQRELDESDQDALAGIDRMLDTMAANWRNNMTPRARAAWEAYQRIEAEERGRPGAWGDEGEEEEGEDMADDGSTPLPDSAAYSENLAPDEPAQPKALPGPSSRTPKDELW